MVVSGRKDFSQLKRGALELCILGLLRQTESYAFDIARRITTGYEPIVVTQGTVYPLLTRLRRAGLVSATLHESPAGPARKYYRLTKEGNVVLDELIVQWASFSRAVDSIIEETHGDA
jgi:PadR family transcriptional regulator PadR